jgi:AcrR family transcriptional regulator
MRKKAKKSAGKAPGRPGRLSAEETAELPKRLLDAALKVFDRKGYSETTMEEVARAAGASTKTLYSRYANKVELARAVATRMVEDNWAMLRAATSADPKAVEPRLFLTLLGRSVLTRFSGEAAGMIRMAFSEARHFPELVKLHDEILALVASNMTHALMCWKEQGLLPELNDAPRAARLCMSMLTDVARTKIVLGAPITEDDVENHVPFAVDLFLRGLGYESPAA